MISHLITIISFIFPYLEIMQKNKLINNSIKQLENENEDYIKYMEGYNKLSIDDAKNIFDETFEYKKILEEKAKINVFSITISVTIITSLAKVLLEFNNSVDYAPIKISLYILASLSLLYMTMAGFLSLKMIVDLNTVYQFYPSDYSLGFNEKLKLMAFNTELNSKMNAKRNNYINVSYKNIRNSIICLMLVFLLIASPFSYHQQAKQINDSKKLSLEEINLKLNQMMIIQDKLKDETNKIIEEVNGLKQVLTYRKKTDF